MKKQLSFQFTATEQEAQDLCERISKQISRYMRKNFPPHYTPWQSNDKNDTAHFVVWYKI